MVLRLVEKVIVCVHNVTLVLERLTVKVRLVQGKPVMKVTLVLL